MSIFSIFPDWIPSWTKRGWGGGGVGEAEAGRGRGGRRREEEGGQCGEAWRGRPTPALASLLGDVSDQNGEGMILANVFGFSCVCSVAADFFFFNYETF